MQLRWDTVKTLCVRNVIDYNNDVGFTQTACPAEALRVQKTANGSLTAPLQYTERFWEVCFAEREKRASAGAS